MRALILALVAGCGAPPWPTNELVDPPPWAEQAAEIAAREWGTRLGEPVALPPIYWFEGECLDYKSLPCWEGATWTPGGISSGGEIHLLIATHPGDTLLAHEALHWALYIDGGEDSWHTRPEWGQEGAVRDTLDRLWAR